MLRRACQNILGGMFFCLVLNFAALSGADEIVVVDPPQRFLVVAEHARFLKGNEVAGTVPQGTILSVIRANGNWRYSPDCKGWIHLREVIPLEGAIAEMDRRIAREVTRSSLQLRGIARMAQEDWEKAAQDFEEAYELGESSINLHYNLGVCYERMGESVAAMEEFDRILKTYPDEIPTRLARANLLLETKQAQAGLRDLDYVLKIKPESADAHNSRGIAFRILKRYPEAIAAYNEAIRLDPRRADSICNRGYAKKQMGNLSGAQEDYEAAYKLAPTSLSIRNDLAWFLATCPDEKYRDPKRSVSLSEAVCSENGNLDPDFLDTLAAGYAQLDRLAAAIETAKLALTHVEDEEQAQPIRERLKLYESGKAFLEEPHTPSK